MLTLAEKVDFLMEYIVGRTDDFALQTSNGRYTRAGRELTELDVLEHVVGNTTVGMYQMFDDGLVKWVCYDIDNHCGTKRTDIDYKLITNQLTREGVPWYVEHSGTPESYHIWVFLDEPVDVSIAHAWAHSMITVNGVKLSTCEIYPKQSEYNPDKPYGNLVKMPLGINRKNDVRSEFEGNLHDVETIDISDFVVPEASDYETDATPCARGNASTGAYLGMRPCFKGVVDERTVLEGEQGHNMRIYLAVEGWCTDGTLKGVDSLFRHQPDYDPEETEYQALSVKGYNRTTCRTIKRNCWTFVSKYCETCLMD